MEETNEVKILVVDDRADNLLSIETILEADRYQVVKANSGTAALKILLSQDDFTLILMDVRMPGMSGIETAELIYERERLKHIPIIFITAFDKDEEGMFKGYRMGAVDFIYKPINPQLLRYKVSVFVDLFRKQNQLIEQEKQLRTINASLEQEIQERKASEQKVKELNDQLMLSNQELKASNEELDRFAYVASHDLQEPLRKIIMYSDYIKQELYGQVSQDIYQNFEKIILAASRMRELIKGILQFSRSDYDSGSFELIDLNQVVREVLAEMEDEIVRKEAQVLVDPLPKVWGVPIQMNQLFQNLISNSMKFGQTDRLPEIKIYGEVVKADVPLKLTGDMLPTNYYQIFVKDNGIGFNMEYADTIFGVFKRLHSTKEYQGTGIGLSICKKIVNKHKGSITAQSQVNQGATFIITLPEVVTQADATVTAG